MAAALQAQRLFLTASSSSSSFATRPRRRAAPCRASLRVPNGLQTAVGPADVSLKLDWIDQRVLPATTASAPAAEDGSKTVEKLCAIAEAAADRAEMHDIIGRQRDNWNHLLLHSTNSLALAASVMAALAPAAPTMVALKASAGALLATAAVTMAAVNKIQPSQLAEEQRNATRLWRQLERDVRATLDLRTPLTNADVQDAMDRVLALDAAYPLPLLPGMLDKFPKTVEPARWWPRRRQQQQLLKKKSKSFGRRGGNGNGWSQDLEDEMRGLLRVLKAKDEHQYLTVGKLILSLNRGLAVAGPALAGTAALAAAFIGSGEIGSWASGAAVIGGALAAAANTVEHGGQVGMMFELLRNCAGFYRKIQEDIEASLGEADAELRENGEVFETKVALLLGRSTSDLKQFRRMASASFKDEDIKDFAGKLF
ncbi:probable F-box protein At4g22030 [Phragmites australis]|uniref:probable F-box protein At4g22030 n=1 Tax=Phragmites australis TaxID=29695 RepID=UPI002D79F23E|nr:probable F-box protein At4g22030 [Phragmites australis]